MRDDPEPLARRAPRCGYYKIAKIGELGLRLAAGASASATYLMRNTPFPAVSRKTILRRFGQLMATEHRP
jgi:hypothetical protein